MLSKSVIPIVFIFLIPLLAFCPQTGNLDGDMVGYYTFHKNVNDYSGNEHHGTIYGNPAYKEDRFGTFDHSISLDGVDDYVTFPIGKYPSLAISIWLKPEMENDSAIIFDYGGKMFYSEIDIATSATNPTYRVFNYLAGKLRFPNASFLWLTEWHHMYIDSGNGTNGPKVYLDGYLDKTISNINALMVLNELFYLGTSSDSNRNSSVFYKGEIDELKIFKRTLTPLEITSIYAETPATLHYYQESTIKVVVSPNSQILNIFYRNNNILSTEIISLKGELIYKGNYQQSINISSLKKGFYIVRIGTQNGYFYTTRFVKPE